MKRKQKPPTKRAKPDYDSPVWLTAELCARYRISRRTLRRWGEDRGYPNHWKSGRNEVYSKQEVHEWEVVNMPHLHSKPEMSEEDKHWDRLRRQYLLDKEIAEESGKEPPPKPPRRAPSRTLRV